jgi:Na/Pi-cotransporter
MVQSGIQRAFGPHLRRFLGRALRDRFWAFLAGLGVTAVLQSSTATGLMVTGLAAGGLVDLVPALAVMLGANVGTTLIVQVLSFDIGRVAPLFVLIGVILFRRSPASRTRDLGRVAIGLGLMLFALEQLLALLTPYEDVPSLRLLMGAIATQPIIDVIVAAVMTWAAHSSVATMLLIMSLAAQGVVPPDAAFALVLGANLGSALNPLLEGAAGSDRRQNGRRSAIWSTELSVSCLGWHCSTGSGAGWLRSSRTLAGPSPISTPDLISSWRRYFCRCCNPSPGCWCGCCRPARCRPIRPGRSISTVPHTRPRRSPWPLRRAKRCAWPMCSRRCCAGRSMRSTSATASGSARPGARRRARPSQPRDQGLPDRPRP